eukprot:m.43137 g.43137  ORF g.43137 m.43137 type:complete len:226 (-) comp10770_c0_seq1:732-1409(-)
MGNNNTRELDSLQETAEGLHKTIGQVQSRTQDQIDSLEHRLDKVEAKVEDIGVPTTSKQSSTMSVIAGTPAEESAAASASTSATASKRVSYTPDPDNPHKLFRASNSRVHIFADPQTITLQRQGSESFGFSLITLESPNEEHAVLIKAIHPDGIAEKEGTLKAHDRVVSVNGIPMLNATLSEAAEQIRSCGTELVLQVAHLEKIKRPKGKKPTKAAIEEEDAAAE